jgi:ABC-type sugar transport system ATPase subunit
VVEYLGDEQIVHLLCRERPIVAKLPVDQRVERGESRDFHIPRERLQLFDAETQQAITRP